MRELVQYLNIHNRKYRLEQKIISRQGTNILKRVQKKKILMRYEPK